MTTILPQGVGSIQDFILPLTPGAIACGDDKGQEGIHIESSEHLRRAIARSARVTQ